MSVFRMSSPSDVVAGAVALGGHLPVDEVAVMSLDRHPAAVMLVQLGDDAERESGRILDALESAAPLEENQSMLAVVFGPAERGDVVGAILERLHPDAVTPVFVFTDGLVRQWHGAGSLIGQPGMPVDLAAHPIIAEALVVGSTTLMTRAEMRASFTPAQHGPDRAATVAAGFGRERVILAARAPQNAADRAYDFALAPYVGGTTGAGERGISVTDEHAAIIAAAMHDVPVRDLLFARIDAHNADAAAEVMRQVGAVLPHDLAGTVIILAGVFHWVSRHAALAREAVNVGRSLDPAHSLGKLFEQFLNHGMNPALWEQVRAAAVRARQDQ